MPWFTDPAVNMDLPMLDLTDLGTALQETDQTQQERQLFEFEATQRKQVLTQVAVDRAQELTNTAIEGRSETREQQLQLLSNTSDLVAKAAEAMRLSQSQNPMDRITLWALQQGDKSYTREGNLQSLEYYRQASAALGDVDAINQGALEDSIKQINMGLEAALSTDANQLELLVLQEKQGRELIDSIRDANASRLGELQTRNGMQEAALTNLGLGQVDAALETARNAGQNSVNVGGIDISVAQLEARKLSLDDREYNQQMVEMNKVTMTLGNMTGQQIEQAMGVAAANNGIFEAQGVKISLARLQDRKNEILSGEAGAAANTMGLMSIAEDRVIKTFNATELNNLLTNGGIDSVTGMQYDVSKLRQARDSINEAQTAQTANDIMLATVGEKAQAAVDHLGWLESLQPPRGSQLEVAIQQSKAVNNVAAGLLNSDDTQMRVNGIHAIQGQRQQVEDLISAEAKRMSLGDKNREAAYNATLRGQPIPADVVRTAVSELADKGQPISGWLTPALAGTYDNVYRTELASIKMSQESGNLDIASQRAMASEKAFNAVINEVAAKSNTDYMVQQISMPDNPLRQAFGDNAALVTNLMHEADVEGRKKFQETTKFTDEQMAANADSPDLAATQNALFLIKLDQHEAGLGDKYVDWWNSSASQEYTSRFTAQIADRAKGNFQEAAQTALLLPTLQDNGAEYSRQLVDGQRRMVANQLRDQHFEYINFGNDPTAMQVFNLEMDTNLTPTQKQQAMQEVILPLITQAKSQNPKATPTEINTYVEQGLRTTQFDNTSTRSLVKTILQNRDQALEVTEKFALSKMLWNQTAFGGTSNLFRNGITGTDETQREVSAFSWWTSMQQGQ